MGKIILMIALLVGAVVSMDAQILRTEELEKYAIKEYGEKWVDASAKLASSLSLDKNNALTFTQVIEAPGKTAEQLYVILNYWFVATFNDANSVIKLNDKEVGTIIAQGFMPGIAGHTGGMNSYVVNIRPIIKCDIKEEKVRVTYTVPYYTVVKEVGGGSVAKIMTGQPGDLKEETWTLDQSYPFAEKDSHKKTSSKALIMSYAYSNVVMDKIEECVKAGLVGNETEDW